MSSMRTGRTLGKRLHIAEHEATHGWTRQSGRCSTGGNELRTRIPARRVTDIDGCHEAVLDGGAQSIVFGRDTLTRHADHLRDTGIDRIPKHFNCDKTFRFGNDMTTRCKTFRQISR